MCSTTTLLLFSSILLPAVSSSPHPNPSIPHGIPSTHQWRKPLSPNGGARYYPKRNAQQDLTSFSIHQVRNPEFDQDTHRNGLQALVHAYAKYGVELTPEIKAAVRINPTVREISLLKRSGNITASTPAVPPRGFDWEFVSPVEIGTPPQTLNLDLDTGSADLWVFSSHTPLEQVTDDHAIYDPNLSDSSSLLPNQTWKIRYGDGSGASGIVYTDRVSIGNAISPKQVVECATYVSSIFSLDPYCSGILGLGMSHGASRSLQGAIPANESLTFMDNILDQLAMPLFTANLKHSIPGTYSFGFINESEFLGGVDAVTYTPVDQHSAYWTFLATGYGVGPKIGHDLKSTTQAGNPVVVGDSLMVVNRTYTAIADTGATLLLVPSRIVRDYYARVARSFYDPFWAGMIFPCEADLPDFHFYIGRGGAPYRGVVPGRYINYVSVNGTHCYGEIQSSDAIGFAVFGAMALKSQFVVFDVGGMRIGFAEKELVA